MAQLLFVFPRRGISPIERDTIAVMTPYIPDSRKIIKIRNKNVNTFNLL